MYDKVEYYSHQEILVVLAQEMKPDKVPNPSGVGTIEDYWGPSKKLLNDIKFLEGLQNYDKDNIPPPVMKKLMTTVMQDEAFVPEKMRVVSIAAEGKKSFSLVAVTFVH